MTIQFSALDKIALYDVAGTQDEQYQPAWEPGNIFSYPAGPQITAAKAGDQLYLQARVYNYSFKAMDPGTVVHTRFYLQRMNANDNSPIDTAGKFLWTATNH
jgi:hypothetical protein